MREVMAVENGINVKPIEAKVPTTMCQTNEINLVDQIVATCILVLFFLIGTLSNLSFISIYLHKQRRRSTPKIPSAAGKGGSGSTVAGTQAPTTVSIRSTCIRIKNQVSNKAIFTLSISNLLLSSLFIPYTIVYRVWNLDANWLLLAILEHLKDNLLYMNLLIITILSIERYVAVCKPQHYKKLESNINKIIWIVFLIGFVLSGTNYFINVKSDLVCSASIFMASHREMSPNDAQNNASASSEQHGSINFNLLTSGVLFSASACITTFFYIQIAWHHLKRAKQFKRKCASSADCTTKRVSIDNKSSGSSCLNQKTSIKKKSSTCVVIAVGDDHLPPTRSSKAVETTTYDEDDDESNSLMQRSSFKAAASICGGDASEDGGGRGDSTANQVENTTTNNSNPGNEESDFSKCKSDASVQTDFFVPRKNKKAYKKRYSNIFATNLITKISIWLSVIIWVSIVPFLLSVLKIVPFYRFIYFLYYIENVFSPLVYICLNKRYRNYLKKVFKHKFKL